MYKEKERRGKGNLRLVSRFPGFGRGGGIYNYGRDFAKSVARMVAAGKDYRPSH